MAALNQAKIIKELEKMVTAPNNDFIFSFLSAYAAQELSYALRF